MILDVSLELCLFKDQAIHVKTLGKTKLFPSQLGTKCIYYYLFSL